MKTFRHLMFSAAQHTTVYLLGSKPDRDETINTIHTNDDTYTFLNYNTVPLTHANEGEESHE
jgi:hypothetical protein